MRAEADYRLFYALLDDLTPLAADCGTVCDAACCRDCSGMRLFPGEEGVIASLMSETDGFTFRQAGQDTLLVCNGHCWRGIRPLACRIFPLFPYVDEKGRVKAVYDPRAWRVCPLVKECRPVSVGGVTPSESTVADKTYTLQRPFVRAVRRIGRLLMQDDRCRTFLMEQSREIDDINRFLRLEEMRAPICRRRP